jgi:Xaa-Pro aminopeptidase
MGYGQYGAEYIGHGVGLEVNEPRFITPLTSLTLQPGMVLALEQESPIEGRL